MSERTQQLPRQILVVVAVVATIVVNGLANALPINGQGTGAVSAKFDHLFVPAGYVFSIWGLIYLGLIAYAIVQALPSRRGDPFLRAIDGPVVLASLANITWIFMWHHEYFPASLAVMFVLLAALIAVYLRLQEGGPDPLRRWTVDLCFSVYLGWISVATIANASVVLVDLGWGGWGVPELGWLTIMLAVALGLGAAMAWTRGDLAYVLVLVWAFAGIAIRHRGVHEVASTVAWVAAGLAAALAVLAVLRASGGRSQPAPKPASARARAEGRRPRSSPPRRRPHWPSFVLKN